MPNWSPNWENVRWDWGAADAAMAALRRVADRLDATANENVRIAGPAQAEWRGARRLRFDDDLASTVRKEHALADECRRMAGRISDASSAAHREQDKRERDRRRWEEEKREEERRERERNR